MVSVGGADDEIEVVGGAVGEGDLVLGRDGFDAGALMDAIFERGADFCDVCAGASADGAPLVLGIEA